MEVKIDMDNQYCFYGRLLDDGRYEQGLNTAKASFDELAQLLAMMKTLEQEIIDHIGNLEPEVSIKKGFSKDEE
jgi:hypothetical protein